MTEPYVAELKDMTKENEDFREVVFSGAHSQLVVMSIGPRDDIGMETHADVDQMLYVVRGKGTAILAGKQREFQKGSVICVPAGTEHNIVNGDDQPPKLFTVYSPPEHAPGTVQKSKPAEHRGVR
jgi:mannose-6-phosphate isomerase-like protein (cupin superfamily)